MNIVSRLISTEKSSPDHSGLLISYAFAVVATLVTLALTLLLDQSISRSIPSLFFLPAVAASAWNGGYKPGILAAVLSAVTINYFFLSSFFTLPFTHPMNLLQTILFLTEGVFMSFLIDKGKRSERGINYPQREKTLKEKIASLQQANTSAQKEIRSRDEFLSIASHELKTPLTSMLLQTQTALHNIRNVSLARFSIEDLLKMLESVENQTKRLSKMINDLLNISLITTGNLQLERERVDLSTVVKNVIKDFSARLQKENCTVIYKDDEAVVGYWDKVRIEQAVANLLSNSIKYGQHSPIEIKTRKNDGFAQLSIKDSGIGISKEQQKLIFGLFERAVTPEQYKGLGVGLYITHQIVKAHNGIVMVSSKIGKGSTFIIELPLQTKAELSSKKN